MIVDKRIRTDRIVVETKFTADKGLIEELQQLAVETEDNV